ncbi:MAG: hypothetical protein AAF288_12855 [Planctomycetota bacterium]
MAGASLACLTSLAGSAEAQVDYPAALGGIDGQLARQMDKFAHPGDYPAGFETARLLQSYDVPIGDPSYAAQYHRADIYDTSVAAIYLTRRGELGRAQSLLDGIRMVQQIDPLGDGRVRAAYYANDLQSPGNTGPSISSPDTAVGNMSWAGIALATYYAETGDRAYLDAARQIGSWIDQNVRQPASDGFGGYSLGQDQTGAVLFGTGNARSTEHNLDVYSFASSLYALDRDPVTNRRNPQWQAMADHAGSFVQAMYDPARQRYWTGTQDGPGGQIQIATVPVPADTQTWTALTGLDDPSRAVASMRFLVDTPNTDPAHLLVTDTLAELIPGDTRGFVGTRFTDQGAQIQSENTAGAALALAVGVEQGWLFEAPGEPADKWADQADVLIASLDAIRTSAPGADPNGLGVVATPWPDGAPTGFGFAYPNLRHSASTAWTGLALLYQHPDPATRDLLANPLGPLVNDTPEGDYDQDGVLGPGDIDTLRANLGDAVYDLDGDGISDAADVALLVEGPGFAGTSFGDANLDGEVDLVDFDALSQGFGGPGGWGQGDFTGDGVVDLLDFDVLAQNFDAGEGVELPEPGVLGGLAAGLGALRRR